MTTCQFDFEEMKLAGYGEGILLYGIATLESDCEDDSYFYVASIQLGKRVLTRPSRINSANVFDDILFTEIANQIESPRTVHGGQAERSWADAVSEQTSPIPALRRRPGMPLTYSTLASVPEIDPRSLGLQKVGA